MDIVYPEGLSNEARNFITVVIAKLTEVGAIEDCDEGAMHMLMVSYDMYIKASNELLKHGPILYDKRMNPTINPAAKLAKNYYAQVLAFMKEYGLTVKSRERIKVMTPEVDEDNEIMMFLRGDNIDEEME